MSGRLVLVGTPIGNRADLAPRAREALERADLLLCEDTRSPTRLLGEDAKLPRRVSCFVGNEHERVAMLLEALDAGQTVAFVSEAGMPVWSDPGHQLVRAAVDAGYEVDVVPGPVAAAAALALSGFGAEGACFWGFIERSGPGRKAALGEVVAHPGPSLLYEAGNRTPALLRDLARVAPDRSVVVARELTKLHQEVLRGTTKELAEQITEPLRGEVCVVVAGAPRREETDGPSEAQRAGRAVLEAVLDPDLRPKERAKAIAAATGLDGREVYARLSNLAKAKSRED